MREMRSAICEGKGPIPADEYAFDEYYCVDPKCDCRRTMLMVYRRQSQDCLAVISHSFDPPSKDRDSGVGQTFLDPMHKQSSFAPTLLELFTEQVLTGDYPARLVRHYRMVKDALADPKHEIHRIVNAKKPTLVGARTIQPNVRCPCGSGKKFKKCCGRLG